MPDKGSAITRRAAAQTRRPPKGVKAGKGAYLFEMARINSVDGGPDYSTAKGSLVEGERFMMGLMRMPKGTGASAHSHPNEQWVYIIEGDLSFEVDGVKGVAHPGSLLYFPPNAVHGTQASPDRDVVFLTGKDRSHGLWGIPVDAKPGQARAKPRAKATAARKR
jgi:quercetin dioxygenase-like cupin family protein